MRGIQSGGSDHSLYYHIINLNANLYDSIILFNQADVYSDNLIDLGFNVIIEKIPQKIKVKKKPNPKSNDLVIKKRKTHNSQFNIILELKALLKSLPEIIFVIKKIRYNKIDLLHTNFNLSSSRGAVIAGILSRVPVIVHNRGLSNLLKIDIFISRFVKKIICISEFVKQEYIRNGIDKNKCTVIYNGVDLKKFKPCIKQTNEKFIVSSVGRLEKWKGQSLLINAASTISKSHKEIEFWIIGDGSERENIIRQIESLGLCSYIKLFGDVSNVNKYLQKSDVLVHTSIEPEPFGRVIIEAMATEIPVISTNFGGPLEIIDNEIDGFLISPNNSDELASKITRLLENHQLREQIGRSAKIKVEKEFNIIKTTKLIETQY